MSSNFTVDYFIDKFSKIPDELWRIKTYHEIITINNEEFNQCCALGHCGVRHTGHNGYSPTQEGNALNQLFWANGLNVATTNDNSENHYLFHSTPKSRILAALNNIKNKKQIKST